MQHAPLPDASQVLLEPVSADAQPPLAPPKPLPPANAVARWGDEYIEETPEDLYIPPDALQVFLETFEGPLDLLLYLIQRQNLDILNIPIAEITRQYLLYIDLMQDLELDLAAEYLVMAALLLEIKSRMLLPREEDEESGEEQDPRARLVQQLQEYARIKEAAEQLGDMPMLGRDLFLPEAHLLKVPMQRPPPDIPYVEFLAAIRDLLLRMELYTAHQITREPLSVRERMTLVLDRLRDAERLHLQALFTLDEGRPGVVVAMLAVLELCKEKLVEVEQEQAFGPVEIYAKPGDGLHDLSLPNDFTTDLD